MSKIRATEGVAIACAGMIAGGLTYWVSRAKFHYTAPLTWMHGGVAAGLTSGVGVMLSIAARSAKRSTHPSHFPSLGEFTAPTPQELCNDDILWARRVGVDEPRLEQQIRPIAAANQVTGLLVPRMTLLLLGADREGWDGADRTRLLAIGGGHRLQIGTSRHLANNMLAITRDELRQLVAGWNGTVSQTASQAAAQIVLRVVVRTLVWYIKAFDLDPLDEFDEIACEIDNIAQSSTDVNSWGARLASLSDRVDSISWLLTATDSTPNAVEATYQVCGLRVDLLKVVLEERGYVVYVHEGEPEDGLFQVEVIGGADSSNYEISDRQAFEVSLIRDILEHHPPLG